MIGQGQIEICGRCYGAILPTNVPMGYGGAICGCQFPTRSTQQLPPSNSSSTDFYRHNEIIERLRRIEDKLDANKDTK